MCLRQYAVENELHKENMNSSRLVGLPGDLQHAHKYEIKIVNDDDAEVLVKAAPKRESRNKK